MKRKIQIGIMGSQSDLNYSKECEEFAKKLGRLIGESGNILVYGAEKDFNSLSTIAAKEASKAGGITVGVTYNKDKNIIFILQTELKEISDKYYFYNTSDINEIYSNLPNDDKLSLTIGGGKRNVYHRQIRFVSDPAKLKELLDSILDAEQHKYYDREASHLFVIGDRKSVV